VRYVPDGSLCTASARQIFPRDRARLIHRSRSRLHLRSHRFGYSKRPRCRCRLATFGALPTPSMIDRAIITLKIVGSGAVLLAPHRQVRRSMVSIHCWHGHAACRGPYRASGLVLWRKADIPYFREPGLSVPPAIQKRPGRDGDAGTATSCVCSQMLNRSPRGSSIRVGRLDRCGHRRGKRFGGPDAEKRHA